MKITTFKDEQVVNQYINNLFKQASKIDDAVEAALKALKLGAKNPEIVKYVDELSAILKKSSLNIEEYSALASRYADDIVKIKKSLKDTDKNIEKSFAKKEIDAIEKKLDTLRQKITDEKSVIEMKLSQVENLEDLEPEQLKSIYSAASSHLSQITNIQNVINKKLLPEVSTLKGLAISGEGTSLVSEMAGRARKVVVDMGGKALADVAKFTFSAAGLLALGTAAGIWYLLSREEKDAVLQKTNNFEDAILKAHAALSKIKFYQEVSEISEYIKTLEESSGIGNRIFAALEAGNNPSSADLEIYKKVAQQTQRFLVNYDSYYEYAINKEEFSIAKTKVDSLLDTIMNLNVEISSKFSQATSASEQAPTEETSQQIPEIDQVSAPVNKNIRPAPAPNDKGLDVLGQKLFLSQYPEIDAATKSATSFLLNKVLLTPTGLSFWDPQNTYGGGYLGSQGTIQDQVLKHIKFFMNPQTVDRNWALGPIDSERKLRRFIRKNWPKEARKPSSGYKQTRRQYRKSKPSLANSQNNFTKESNFKISSRKERENILEKISNSINNKQQCMKNIDKFADNISDEYFKDALKGLEDKYTKFYITGLKSMYDQKLGGEKADYKNLYETNGETGKDLIDNAHPYSVTVAEGKGNGGLVENGLQQQDKSINVALSNPTGNFTGKHANLMTSLNKIEKKAKDQNLLEASNLIKDTISQLKTILKS